MNRADLKHHVEALIFTSEQSISVAEIVNCLSDALEVEINEKEIISLIDELIEKYKDETYSFEVLHLGGGYQFMTKKDYHSSVAMLIQQKSRKKLSNSAMETLAIIAYKQPITKAEIEHIRGVNSDYSVQKLLEKDLIEISGKSEGPGKPVLYSTSKTFMEYFGINSVRDLPQLKDIYVEQNAIGQQVE